MLIFTVSEVCKFEAGFAFLATPIGHKFQEENNCTLVSPASYVRFFYPRMYSTVAHAVMGLTMLDFMFQNPDEHDLLEILATERFFNVGSGKDKPLRVYASEIMGWGSAVASAVLTEQNDENYKAAVLKAEKAKTDAANDAVVAALELNPALSAAEQEAIMERARSMVPAAPGKTALAGHLVVDHNQYRAIECRGSMQQLRGTLGGVQNQVLSGR